MKLTQVEYAIMRVFMENPGKALSREEILDRVWGRDYFGELKIVDVNIRRLRLKSRTMCRIPRLSQPSGVMVTNGTRETNRLTAHCPGPRTAGRAVRRVQAFWRSQNLGTRRNSFSPRK